MLESKSSVFNILRCPTTGLPLKKANDQFVIADDEKQGISYSIINDMPVLFDFKRSVVDASLFERRRGESVIVRKNSPLRAFLRRIVNKLEKSTVRNITTFIDLIEVKEQPRVLIVGGGTIGMGMERIYNHPKINVTAFDIYFSEHGQFIADAHHMPLPDNYYDGVIIQAVLEHVLEPAQVVAEIKRVLKTDGIVFAETPFMQQVHEGAYDFTRYSELGHRYLFKDFDTIASGYVAGGGTQLLWSIDYFFSGLFRSRKAGKLFKLLFFWLKYFDSLIKPPFNIDAASGVYFLGYKKEGACDAKNIIQQYKGAQK